MRILLVENNSDHIELMRLALSGHDSTWEVEAVAFGEEALCLLLGGEVFDLVFLDYSLLGRDGLEVLEEIRRGEAPPPVVVVTGRGDEKVAVKAMKGGAYDYVVKGEGYLQRLPVVARRAVEAHQLAVERKQAEEALREKSHLNQTLLDAFPCVALLLRPQTREIIASNTAAVKVGAIPGTHCFSTWGQRQDPCPWCPAPVVWDTGKAQHLEVEALGIVWDAHWIPVTEDLYMHFAFDITEHKRAEAEVQASREQMRALARHLQAVREEERTLIAREIHDELGGALTGLKIDVSLLTRAVLKIENETVRTSLLAGMDSMIKFTDATIQTVRRIAMELRPGVLDDLGLVAALEWQLKDFEKRNGIRCEFFPPVEDISLDADLSTALFRIFQEALTNVARHAAATEVRVRLRADADSSTLEMEDNGKGIKKEKILSSKSLGLLGMRERAQIFGGRITVTGTPGIGTKVTVEIPPIEKRKMDRDQEGAAG
jgi:signal transduction histidine kinase/FixJ family two-component response regulator